MNLFQYLRVLVCYMAPYRGTAAGVLLMLMLDVVFSISWPLSLKYLIDALNTNVGRIFIIEAVSALMGAVMLAALSDILRGYGYAVLSSKIKRDARQAVFRRLQEMSMSYFMQQRSRDLIARLSSDISLLEAAVTTGIASFMMGAAGIALSLTLLFFLDWRLALLTLCGLLLCVTLPRPLVRRAAAARAPVEDLESELESTAQETILSQKVVKAFGLGTHFVTSFERLAETLANQSVKSKFLTYLAERAPNVIIVTVQVFIMGLGLLMVADKQRTLGTVIAFQGIFLYVVRSVQTLTQVTPVLLESVMGLQRVQETLREKPAVADAPGAAALAPLSRNINLQNVSFGYGAGQTHLEKLNLTIPCGAFVAFVGASGSGKSTLFNLLVRFYDPDSGLILFDGTDIRQTTSESLRHQMGVVFQESNLFHVSLRENIRFGARSATDKEVEAAARQAEIHEWIASLPDGYDTLAGEDGARLSAGERQRIAIARALVRKPGILLLDEATSALDPEAEAAVNSTLRELCAGRTVISVTHRLTSVQNADCIHFMEQGRVTESGTHAELLAARGAYARLWRRQTGFTVNNLGNAAHMDPDCLRDYPVMSDLPAHALEQAARYLVAESFSAGRNIITQGEMGDRFFLIARGKVEVIKEDNIHAPTTVATLVDGDYFGEIALLRQVPRTATVRALTPTLLLSLQRDHFQTLLKTQPELESRLRQHLPQAQEIVPVTAT